ncbi:MAG: mucoidy inhibitor MuiA family protein [Spirochaetales bacterium]|nr:mucoidy inhibitor MuiA family protein [Spirochaetales bacterium]
MKVKSTEVKSSVSEVTVFQGRAQVTRTVKLRLSAGSHDLIFPDINASIDQGSIQVKGKGESKLGECVFQTEYFSENVDAKIAPLIKQKQELEDRLAEISLDINACIREKTLVEKVAQLAVSPVPPPATQGNQPLPAQAPPINPNAWSDLIDFYHGKGGDIDLRKLNDEREVRTINNDLQRINNELAALGNSGTKSRNIIRLSLSKEKESEIQIDLSYLIYGPSWQPVYNVRAESGSDKILVEYDAFVRQASGEDWSDIRLKLSTARVNVSGIIPVLYPWRLEFYRPEPRNMAVRSMAKKAKSMDRDDAMEMASAPAREMEKDEICPEEMAYGEAEVESGGTAILFSISGGSSIGGDNTDTRVSISRKEFPAEYLYASVPKLSPFTYLTAKIKNNADYPFLPGRTNIFFNGSLTGTSAFDLVMPDQKVETSLGIDEGIKVEYRFIKRFRKNEGIVSKKISEQFEYKIRLTNNLRKAVEVQVFDQFPLSQNREINVKILSPVIKENQKNPALDDESKITWNLKIEPGKASELPVSFLVEYPQGSTVHGI